MPDYPPRPSSCDARQLAGSSTAPTGRLGHHTSRRSGSSPPTAGFVSRFMMLDLSCTTRSSTATTRTHRRWSSNVTLPQYTTGDGVRIVAVAVAPFPPGGCFHGDVRQPEWRRAGTSSGAIIARRQRRNIRHRSSRRSKRWPGCRGPFLALSRQATRDCARSRRCWSLSPERRTRCARTREADLRHRAIAEVN